MRVLVTGGGGFLGSHVIRALLDRNLNVVSLVRAPAQLSVAGLTQVAVDLGNPRAFEQELSRIGLCDAVFHFGAKMPDNQKPGTLREFLDVNVTATGILLDSAAGWNVKRFIYMSSLGIIGKPRTLPVTEDHEVNPPTIYHVSKHLGETLCRHFSRLSLVQAVALRISSPYGPGMKGGTVIPKFVEMARRSLNLKVFGSGNRTQNFVHVSDVVRAAILALDTAPAGVYNVCGPRAVSMRELADTIVSATPGTSSRVERSDLADPQDDYRWEVGGEKARAAFGYQPAIDIGDGLQSLLNDTGDRC